MDHNYIWMIYTSGFVVRFSPPSWSLHVIENSYRCRYGLPCFATPPCCLLSVGTTFLYSTHAFTLLSAVLERAAGQHFLDLMMNMFRELGMLNTVPDENDPIIYNRSR